MIRMSTADRLRWILDLVEESLDQPELTGGDLAARAYLSRFHFDRLAAAALGEPPGAFRRRLLLERAAHRLASTADPVIEVALDAGYGSPEAFARAFGRAYGAAPSAYRRGGAPPPGQGLTRHDLAAASGVHFHPPGGLRLPAPSRREPMDVLEGMLDHHLSLVGDIVDRSAGVGDRVLDQPIELSVAGIDAHPTLRSLTDRLVSQLEMWIAALEGAAAMPHNAASPQTWRPRLDVAGPRFRELVLTPIREGRADDTFVDAICDPPETFSYGGVLAHVLTFAAVRRTMAIGALESAGQRDLGSGDPMCFVGGSGADASTIRRHPPINDAPAAG
jgi:AraC family transcriptional regulator